MCFTSSMDKRYRAPAAEKIWSDQSRVNRWKQITDMYAMDAYDGCLREHQPDEGRGFGIHELIDRLKAPKAQEVRRAEERTGHEVVAFLEVYLGQIPAEYKPFFHYGLTSSDLTEYDLHVAVRDHSLELRSGVVRLEKALGQKADQFGGLPRAGRTHGMTAEVTTLGNQIGVFQHQLERIKTDLSTVYRTTPLKSPGPTGSSDIRQPLDRALGFEVVPSTQIIPRDHLHAWANIYLRLSGVLDSLATWVRLGCRSEVGEFMEGKALDRKGSSAMPGKRNPIQSERVCGLARLARGYHSSITEVTGLWEDRDLSNSSTERVAVPALASTVEHMTDTMAEVINDLLINSDRIRKNSTLPGTRANASQSAVQVQRWVDVLEASGETTNGGKHE